MPILLAGDKKKALLAYKEKLLKDIKYYEKRINEDFQHDTSISTDFVDSSDSEDEFPFTINKGPMVEQLKAQQKILQTCLHATQELSSLCVLGSKLDIMVEDPVINGELPVTRTGVWREVNIDCRIDLVPFSATFFVHQADGLFGAKSYRGLKVLPVKPAQEMELSKSILMRVATPSDAIEVLRNYSVAYRSRRTTLAKLADKYAQNLHMEPLATGGYLLKCANLLEVSWVLETKRSPVAPFYHKMVFDVENMDECYIKIIRNAHKQLGDPLTDTTERTLILSKIIATCLEARDTLQLDESMKSDAESVQTIEKRRWTLENEAPQAKKVRNSNENNEVTDDMNSRDNVINKNNVNIDSQIMAPPKSLPKKIQSKSKGNTDLTRKSIKRTVVENESANGKKPRKDNKNDPNNRKENQTAKNMTVENSMNVKDIDGKNAKAAKNDIPAKSRQNEGINNSSECMVSTENVKAKEKVSKHQNLISKDNKIKKNEKELVKSSKKDGDLNSNNKEETTVSKENNNLRREKTYKISKENVNAQKNLNKEIANGLDSQKVVNEKITSNFKNLSNSKNVEVASDKIVTSQPRSKNAETKKVRSKNKILTNSKNDTKIIYSEGQKTIDDKIVSSQSKTYNEIKNSQTQELGRKNKNVVIATNDQNSEVNKANEPNKANSVIIPKTDQVIVAKYDSKYGNNFANIVEIDDIPIISGNNGDTGKVPKRNNNIKVVKNKKGFFKSTNVNKNVPQNDNKSESNSGPANIKNKEPKSQNVKKWYIKETNSNNKLVSATNTVPKNDKNLKKTSSNNVQIQHNQQESSGKDRKDVQTSNTALNRKTVSNKILLAKDSKHNKNVILNKENTANNKEYCDNNFEIREKVTKDINATTNNKGNMANIKKSNANIVKPKMVIKRFAISKKPLTNLNDSGKIKKGTSLKTDKENNSGSKFSKIPMKLSIHESLKKSNPLRMSPRRMPSTFKSTSDSNVKQKSYFTNIPRLMKN